MNIQDIMRGLPFPVQGLLMQAYGMTGNQQPQQNAGGGRGFVNPPLVNPNAAPPQMPRVQPSRPVGVPKDEAGFEDVIARIMAGGSTDELQNAPAVEATPVQAAMQPDLPAPAAQETADAAPQAPAAPEGLLARFGFSDGNQAMGAIGAALAAAGSADPAKTALAIQAQRGEEAKIAEARRRANMPKFTELQGGAFTRVEVPGMMPVDLPNAAVQKFIRETSEAKSVSDLQRQLAVAQAGLDNKRQFELFDNTVKEAGGANTKPEFSETVQREIKTVDSLIKRVPEIEKLPLDINSPVAANLWDQTVGRFFGTQDFETRRNVDTVFKGATLEVVKNLGANPSEGDRKFAELMQASQDDPLGRKLMLLTEYRNRIEAREESRVRAAQARDSMASRGAAPAAAATPAPTAAPAPAAPAAGGLTVPGLSPRASRYFQ